MRVDDDLIGEQKHLTREEMDRIIELAKQLPTATLGTVVELPWEAFDPLDPETWTR